MIDVQPLGEVAVIRLDRPEKRNAQTPKMLASLVGAIERANSAKAIVLSGVGEVFCAGFDLTLCRDDNTVLEQLLTGLSRAVKAVRTAPCPVVVSAHGGAIAGGCALAAAGDLVITNADAKLGYPVLRLGISPAVNAPVVRASIGDGPARTRLLEPRLIDGLQAHRIGLAHECVPLLSNCEPRAIALAQELAAKPRHALGYTKRWLNELDRTSDDAVLERSLRVSTALVGTEEQRQRLAELWKATEKK
ncbi:MAG TPA: enoyl-CoA hydratase/isomerase family protein [Phycisphaerales bacterium]|nr:enoyl-CoA hydratase/isomerase family protein [Phycisphaerales bacterium]